MHDPEYPRDLIGYAGQPPDPRWPNSARIAISIVLNYEEGAENCILHGDAHSETALTDIDRPDALAGARNLNVESIFEYGSRVGFWEIMRLLRARGIQATIYGVGMALERNPLAVAEIAASGFEVACHGQRWIDYQYMPEAEERAHIARNVEIVTRTIGRAPCGWYTGRPSPNTRRLVVEHGGFLYDSDAYNDDLPYWTRVAGRDHLVVPYSLDNNDSRMTRGQGFNRGEDFLAYVRDAFDWFYRSGSQGRPRMMSIGLHNRLIGRPGRIGALERALDHMQSHAQVWFCSRADIARHWIKHHPASATPSRDRPDT